MSVSSVIKHLFKTFLLICTSLGACAQSLSDGSIVRDSSGRQYPAAEWKTLLREGDHTIEPNTFLDDADFIIYRMDADEKALKKSGGRPPRPSKFFANGMPLAFDLYDMQGRRYNSDSLRGKIVVLNFWYANCGPCIYEMTELNAVKEKYKDRNDVLFLGITFDKMETIEKLLRRKPFNYSIIPSANAMISQYGLNLYPTNLVIDRQGNVRFHTSGYTELTAGYIKKTVNAILRETNN